MAGEHEIAAGACQCGFQLLQRFGAAGTHGNAAVSQQADAVFGVF